MSNPEYNHRVLLYDNIKIITKIKIFDLKLEKSFKGNITEVEIFEIIHFCRNIVEEK